MADGVRSLDQHRAAFAWWAVTRVRDASKYRDRVRGVPALVQSAGLGQAAAYLCAKHRDVYAHLQEWLCGPATDPGGDAPEVPYPLLATRVDNEHHETRLLARLASPALPATVYRRATREALALTVWLKRFAEAVAPEEPSGRAEGGS